MTARKRQWLPACALCAITLLVWANSFASGFIHDSHILVLEDTRVRQATAENIARIINHTYWWPFMESGLYRPVTTLSFLFNYAILGDTDRQAGYHWINLLLHAGNVLLVFALARRLVTDTAQSFLIAAVWAVDPVLTESVTNIAGRSDLMAGMTSLGGLLIYLKSAEASGSTMAGHRLAWLAGLTVVTAVGVFSKESAVAVLGIIWLYELTWWNPRRLRGLLLCCVAMFPAFLALLWMRWRVLAASAPTVFPFVSNPIVAADFWTGA
jgi:protein O-mannosyl-transferase